jgi:hypothetical protein
MTTKLTLTLTLAALAGFAAPALASEHHAAKHDPQVATTAAKPKAAEAPPAKEKKAKGPATAAAAKPAPQPAVK